MKRGYTLGDFSRTIMAEAFLGAVGKKMAAEGKNLNEVLTERRKNRRTAVAIDKYIKKEAI